MAHSSQGTLPYCLQQSRSHKKIGDQKLFFYNNVFINTVVGNLITTIDYHNEDIIANTFLFIMIKEYVISLQ